MKKKKKVKLRIPVAPPSKRHKTKKDYTRKIRLSTDEHLDAFAKYHNKA